jgi:hypothetical protein
MPQFKCITCDAGFYSAAALANLSYKLCPECGSLVEPVDTPSERRQHADRMGHLIARREVARAQARVDAERWADDGIGAPALV